jgi:hypothetical protein
MESQHTITMNYSTTLLVKLKVVRCSIPRFTRYFGTPFSISGLTRDSKKGIEAVQVRVTKVNNVF